MGLRSDDAEDFARGYAEEGRLEDAVLIAKLKAVVATRDAEIVRLRYELNMATFRIDYALAATDKLISCKQCEAIRAERIRVDNILYGKGDRNRGVSACSCLITRHERQENRKCPVHFPVVATSADDGCYSCNPNSGPQCLSMLGEHCDCDCHQDIP